MKYSKRTDKAKLEKGLNLYNTTNKSRKEISEELNISGISLRNYIYNEQGGGSCKTQKKRNKKNENQRGGENIKNIQTDTKTENDNFFTEKKQVSYVNKSQNDNERKIKRLNPMEYAESRKRKNIKNYDEVVELMNK